MAKPIRYPQFCILIRQLMAVFFAEVGLQLAEYVISINKYSYLKFLKVQLYDTYR